jgi:hypothetical protein
MPIRPLLIRLNNEIRFGLFGETPSYQVVRAPMAKCSSVPTSTIIVRARKIRRLPLQLLSSRSYWTSNITIALMMAFSYTCSRWFDPETGDPVPEPTHWKAFGRGHPE